MLAFGRRTSDGVLQRAALRRKAVALEPGVAAVAEAERRAEARNRELTPKRLLQLLAGVEPVVLVGASAVQQHNQRWRPPRYARLGRHEDVM